jgi:hypothetical protein
MALNRGNARHFFRHITLEEGQIWPEPTSVDGGGSVTALADARREAEAVIGRAGKVNAGCGGVNAIAP